MPMFSTLDTIEQVNDSVFGDVNFIAKPERKGSVNLELCFTPGWNHRCMTEFLLHHGIVCRADFTHRLTATAHHLMETFAKPLQTRPEAWRVVEHVDLAKRSVNNLIGLWCLDENFSYQSLSNTREDDAPPRSSQERVSLWYGHAQRTGVQRWD